MLKKFVLKNYKNIKDEIEVDLQDVAGYQFSNDCISDDVISKMLIYGRNATGKTNLGRAFMDIVFTMLPGPRFAENGVFLNADSEEDHARFLYTFGFGEDELIYEYSRFSNEKLRDERLSINGESIFRCDFFNKEYEFDRLKLIHAETANVERYLQAVEEINDYVNQAKCRASVSVNSEIMKTNIFIGNVIIRNSEWGNKFVENLSKDMKMRFPSA